VDCYARFGHLKITVDKTWLCFVWKGDKMNWLKRAYYSTTKCWVRTVILVLIFSVVVALLFCGISIRDASQRMEQQAKGTVGSEVTVAWNLEKASTQPHSIPVRMTEKQLRLLTSQPDVKDNNLITNFFSTAVADGFSPMGDKSRILEHQEKLKNLFIAQGKPDRAKEFQYADMVVFGARKSELCDQFVSGGYKLVSGRPLTEADYGKVTINLRLGILVIANRIFGSGVRMNKRGIINRQNAVVLLNKQANLRTAKNDSFCALSFQFGYDITEIFTGRIFYFSNDQFLIDDFMNLIYLLRAGNHNIDSVADQYIFIKIFFHCKTGT
jgi:hypothetical protein